MGTMDHIAHPAQRITLMNSFSQSVSVHLPPLERPTLEDVLEDRISAGTPVFSTQAASTSPGPQTPSTRHTTR
ncbi:hypothetical protein E8P82_14415 [Arthrobacter echini]|uniref:Uncharacterized protein n=2 Tax=Arthrobacter echini TaxID=1529066 RepID=A0A5D0XKX1_9MICC|nr:hypothetical protein [Arthrobacter echini]THJ64699.1 hypothetical protein E8P82_14415 [Arthrobacter echini]TYC97122.1 hypothetical protein FQ377_13155 [Arthrobacter echini]